jgi:hypothetical protein
MSSAAVKRTGTAALSTVRRQGIPDFRWPDLKESFDSSGSLSGGFLSVV